MKYLTGRLLNKGHGMRLIATLILALTLLLAGSAPRIYALLASMGATNNFGFPQQFTDTNGLSLEFCDPQNQAELDGGWCLLLPADTSAPELFPSAFSDEHFYWAADAGINFAGPGGGGTARLVLALEAAFARGPVRPTDQQTFGRTRVKITNLPYSGTYTVFHPYGTETFTNQVAGDVLFFTNDVGINCGPGRFDCTLAANNPFLLPAAVPGGAVLPPVAGPVLGKSYIADPARIGPITGSPLGRNSFRVEGPNGFVISTSDFNLMGRMFTPPAPPPDTPLAVDDQAPTNVDTPVDINVLANDTYNGSPIDPLAAGVDIVAAPLQGTAAVNPDGTIHYTPNLGVFTPNSATNATDTFTYSVSVGGGTPSNTVTVMVLVKPQNLLATGPTVPRYGFPKWYQDKNLLSLEFCDPLNQAELDGGWCLLLPADTSAPERFPTPFSDEHFYWAGNSQMNFIGAGGGAGKAILTLALEAAFATGPVRTGDQITFGRTRIKVTNLPFSGTYTVRHPYGTWTFPDQVAGGILSFVDDIGTNCGHGLFNCTMNSDVGPFLLPADTAGGAALPPVAGPIPGMMYVADPARLGPVTGSPVGQNLFQIDGPLGFSIQTSDFSLMGRLFSPPVAVNDQATTDENVLVTINVLGNDTFDGGSVIPANAVVSIVNPPTLGTVSVNPDGTLKYSPNPNATGSDSFTYIATVDGAASNLATINVAITPVKRYFWNYYDSKNMKSWLLISNPADSGAGNVDFMLNIGGIPVGLGNLGAGPGIVSPGQTLTFINPGMAAGPAVAGSRFQKQAIVSQRSLMGSSLEEVPGIDEAKLADHFYWTWYDMLSPGFKNWILVTNPSVNENVRVNIKFVNVAGGGLVSIDSPNIAPGTVWSPTFPGKMGGPVELKAFVSGGNWSIPGERRDVVASQRVLTNNGTAFNELPGIPVRDLSNRYLWTWYDMSSRGFKDWVLIANPDPANAVGYEIKIGGATVQKGSIPAGKMITPVFPGRINGPVEVITTATGTGDGKVIASQRVIAGPSFEEVPAKAALTLASTYYWTWYDMTRGFANWVLIANPDPVNNVTYQLRVGGAVVRSGSIPAGGRVTPVFPGRMGGPVEVQASRPVISSQRVLLNGYFNEVLGTDLSAVP